MKTHGMVRTNVTETLKVTKKYLFYFLKVVKYIREITAKIFNVVRKHW